MLIALVYGQMQQTQIGPYLEVLATNECLG